MAMAAGVFVTLLREEEEEEGERKKGSARWICDMERVGGALEDAKVGGRERSKLNKDCRRR